MSAEDDGEGRWRIINPLAVRFSQPRVAPHFRDGHLLDETVEEVVEDRLEDPAIALARPCDPCEAAQGAAAYDTVLVPPFPAIRIISWLPKIRRPDGEAERDENGDQILGKRAWFALDNRRLQVLQNAAARIWPRRCCIVVRCIEEVPGGSTMKEIRKFRTTTEGRSVEVGVRVGDTRLWTWQRAVSPGVSAPVEPVMADGAFAEDLWDATLWAPHVVAADASKVSAEDPKVNRKRVQAERQRAGSEQTSAMGGRLVPCPMMGWQYIDPTGKIQGPFPLDKMRLWHRHNYFLPDLPMRCDVTDSFVPFVCLFPSIEPFQSEVMRYAAST